MAQISTINRYIKHFADAFHDLSVNVPLKDIERLAIQLHQAMEQGRRVYHSSTHVLNVCKGQSGTRLLAALFHDMVYCQSDNGLPPSANSILSTAVQIDGDVISLKPFAANDLAMKLCCGVFGFDAGDPLPLYGGLNEMLSAVVATRVLQPYLSTADLIAIAACIEATIPFRGTNPAGLTCPENLAHRLERTAQICGITFSKATIDRWVSEAIKIANQDLCSFSLNDPGEFLATTWQLLEESNAPLNAVGAYTVREYRNALTSMEKFLGSLNSEHVFHHYRNTPDANEYAVLQQAAYTNVRFAVKYLGTKIASIALIEALAQESGGDAPVSMFLGDIRSADGPPQRIEHFLTPIESNPVFDKVLMSVLEQGRSRECNNDLTNSPLTAYLYRYLGDEGIARLLSLAHAFFAGELTPKAFLDLVDRRVVQIVAKGCSRIAISRSETLAFWYR